MIGPEIFMYLQWAGYILFVLYVVAKDWIPAWVPYLGKMRKTVEELKEVINKSPVSNSEFKSNAEKDGLKEATKVLKDLE